MDEEQYQAAVNLWTKLTETWEYLFYYPTNIKPGWLVTYLEYIDFLIHASNT